MLLVPCLLMGQIFCLCSAQAAPRVRAAEQTGCCQEPTESSSKPPAPHGDHHAPGCPHCGEQAQLQSAPPTAAQAPAACLTPCLLLTPVTLPAFAAPAQTFHPDQLLHDGHSPPSLLRVTCALLI